MRAGLLRALGDISDGATKDTQFTGEETEAVQPEAFSYSPTDREGSQARESDREQTGGR